MRTMQWATWAVLALFVAPILTGCNRADTNPAPVDADSPTEVQSPEASEEFKDVQKNTYGGGNLGEVEDAVHSSPESPEANELSDPHTR